VEHHDDKVFIEPLREGVATNLFIWTESRQLTYELDPSGQLATMDVLIRTEPAPKSHSVAPASVEPSDVEIRKMASLVLAQAMMGVQGVARDGSRPVPDRVQVDLEQVYRAKDQLYIRYSITNQTKEPFRLTTPDVSAPLPTQLPISLLSLRNHQLSTQTFDAFKTKPGSTFTPQFIAGDERSVGAHHHVAAIWKVSQRQQFTHGGRLQFLFVFCVSHWHSSFLFPVTRNFTWPFNLSAVIRARGEIPSWKRDAKTTLANTA
jgi:hypothetical protein